MAKVSLEKKSLWFGIAFVLVAGLLIGYFLHSLQVPAVSEEFTAKSIDEQWAEVIAERDVAVAKA